MGNAKQPIDWELSIKLANNNSDLAQELLAMLIASLPEFRDKIQTSHKQDNLEELYMQTHKLHGSSSFCGVPTIKTAANKLENALIKKEYTNLAKLVAQLTKNIDQVLELYDSGEYK